MSLFEIIGLCILGFVVAAVVILIAVIWDKMSRIADEMDSDDENKPA